MIGRVRNCLSPAAVLLVAMISIAGAIGVGALPALGEPVLQGERGGLLLPLPDPPLLNSRRVALGERLFHDKLLSKRRMFSCSSCHDLSAGGTIHVARTVGYQGEQHLFNAPTIFNVGNNYRLGWRGKFTDLATQNEAVIQDRNLMAMDWPSLLSRLNAEHSYITEFIAVYGRPPDRRSVLDALVNYQKSLITPDAPFDRYLKGDEEALSALEKRGLDLFVEYGCASCHQGSNIGGNMFQIFGVFGEPGADVMPTPDELERHLQRADRGQDVYRVPSLRNVALTAPYFHDGRTETLREAISIMGLSQLGRPLSSRDLDALEAFLGSLTGVYNVEQASKPVPEATR